MLGYKLAPGSEREAKDDASMFSPINVAEVSGLPHTEKVSHVAKNAGCFATEDRTAGVARRVSCLRSATEARLWIVGVGLAGREAKRGDGVKCTVG